MTASYVAAGAVAANTSAATTLNVAYPAGLQANDILVVMVGVASATLPTNPTGFTSRITNTSGGSSPSFRVSTKVATGSESGTLAVTTPSATSRGIMLCFRGIDTTTPIDVAGTVFGSSTAVTAYNIPTLTTSMAGVALAYIGIGNAASGTFTPPTVPAAFTEVTDTATAIPGLTAGYLIWSSSGATGTINLVKSASVRGAAGVIALRPATAAGSAALDITATGAAAAGGGGGTPASGTAALDITAAGATAAAIGGTASLSFTASGTPAAPVTGSASVTLTASGTGRAPITGTASLTLTAAGTGAAPVTGSAAMTLTASGTAGGGGAVSGTAAIDVTATGTARAATTGTAALTLTATGVARAPISGTATITVTATGTARAPVTGTAAVSIDATATARAAIAGTATVTLTATGTAVSGTPATSYRITGSGPSHDLDGNTGTHALTGSATRDLTGTTGTHSLAGASPRRSLTGG